VIEWNSQPPPLTQWTGPGANNHWYLAVCVPGGITWSAAKATAVAQGGYLATSTSAAENGFIFSLINEDKFWANDGANNSEGPYLGGYYVGAPGTMNPNDWAWVTGEPWVYKNWAAGQPDFTTETVLNFFGWGLNNRQPTWNNLPNNTNFPRGYVVEWNTLPTHRGGISYLPLLLLE
jgi:hypothetical protein